MKRLALFVLFLSTLASAAPLPFKKVFVIVFENTDYDKTMKQSFFAELAEKGTVFENFFAVARPSQPNYIALVGGDTFGIKDNDNHNIDKTSIVDLLEAKQKSWKVYAQGYPGHCDKRAVYRRYARKHQPLISFVNIQKNAERCEKIVNASALKTDVLRDAVPDFALYIPDMDNSGHDTSVTHADRWFRSAFADLLKDADFLRDRLFIVTFDEGDPFNPKNQIYTLFLGEDVKRGYRSKKRYDLYSILHTVEEGLGLGSLNRKDASAPVISDAWLP